MFLHLIFYIKAERGDREARKIKNYMKSKSLSFVRLLAVLFGIVVVSCQENSEPAPVEPQLSLEHNGDEFLISRDGERKVLYFQNNVPCEVKLVSVPENTVPWCKFGAGEDNSIYYDPCSGYGFSHVVAIEAPEYFGLKDRYARLEFYLDGTLVKSLSVRQESRLFGDYGNPVDLGLSVKWASVNIGAGEPTRIGTFYAWGDTEKQELTGGSWGNYKWCDGSEDTMNKYCTDTYWGYVDNKTTLDLEDDVAHVLWGDGWRMPTMEEFQELVDKCTWRWLSVDGVNGYRITGPNGNKIFMPATSGSPYYGQNIYGNYWTSTLHESDSNSAIRCFFNDNSSYTIAGTVRYTSCAVRPVKE